MNAHKLIWINTRDDILDAIGDAVVGMQESGMYSDDYILEYLDDYIGRKCDIAFVGFDSVEDKFARIDMHQDMHNFFNLGE